MLFNSYFFIFLFFPCVLGVFIFLNGLSSNKFAKVWLVGSSIFFYGWWNANYVPLILFSIVMNYTLGLWLSKIKNISYQKKIILASGIIINLGLLGYYKYLGFFMSIGNGIIGTSVSINQIILPLAISFFTFQQITYLVDSYKEKVDNYDFTDYCLFVTFFPQLIAGPIVHHKEILKQFKARWDKKTKQKFALLGSSIFLIGLFKKVVIADNIGILSDKVFSIYASGGTVSIFDSWIATFSYTFQIYFDFSGYCDMAVGIGYFFGIILPVNFLSPYKSSNIVEFWRRWHITLGRFFKEYLYIPLGGNRKGFGKTIVNLSIVMILGGLWHGANWTFLLWGCLHGFYFALHFLLKIGRNRIKLNLPGLSKIGALISTMTTFFAVAVAWVLFRADSVSDAFRMYKTMFGLSTEKAIVVFEPVVLLWILLLLAIVWFLPNIYKMYRINVNADNAEELYLQNIKQSSNFFQSYGWGIMHGTIFFSVVLLMAKSSEFLYFQF